jgi:protein-S-isoprenylcysteine O-methyltransferase Ste14
MDKWKTITRWALFFEDSVLPFLLLYFTITNILFFVIFRQPICQDFQELFKGIDNIRQISFLLDFNTRIISTLFNLVVLLTLIRRKKQAQSFENIKELAIPLATIFFYLAYNIIPLLPKNLDNYLLPPSAMPVVFSIGHFFIFSGLLIATISTLNLNHSFAVFIEARGVVTKGMYSVTRHPIYLGHLLKTIGACLLNFFSSYFFLSFLFICLLIYRSLLEEKKMLKHCPEYAEYKRKTPSLFLQLFFLDRKTILK